LEPLALALELGRPVSRGFALVLVALVLAALGWVDHRQAARLDAVESAVAGTTSSVVQGARATVADPDPCWLLGVIAGAQGKADLVSRLGSTTSSTGTARCMPSEAPAVRTSRAADVLAGHRPWVSRGSGGGEPSPQGQRGDDQGQ
jgi:hypothetical protein